MQIRPFVKWDDVYSRFITQPLLQKSLQPQICAAYCANIPPTSRRTHNSKINYSSNHSKDELDYVPVYHFPYIRVFSVINRIKRYQTVLTGAGVPASFILNQLGLMSMDTVQFIAALGLSGCLVLHTAGYLTSKFIGIIYYNKSSNTAKISYVDFWGSRRNVEIPVSDIMPVNELPRTAMDGIYLIFRRFSTKDTLRLSLKYGVVLDSKLIKKVL